jgi:hypothetical protein
VVVVDHRSLLEEGVVDTLMINSGRFRTPVGPIVSNDKPLPDNPVSVILVGELFPNTRIEE